MRRTIYSAYYQKKTLFRKKRTIHPPRKYPLPSPYFTQQQQPSLSRPSAPINPPTINSQTSRAAYIIRTHLFHSVPLLFLTLHFPAIFKNISIIYRESLNYSILAGTVSAQTQTNDPIAVYNNSIPPGGLRNFSGTRASGKSDGAAALYEAERERELDTCERGRRGLRMVRRERRKEKRGGVIL